MCRIHKFHIPSHWTIFFFMNIFILIQRQNFYSTPLLYSLFNILCASLFTHQDTRILNNVFPLSMDVTSLYTPGGYSKTFYPGRLRLRSNPLPLYTILDRKGTLFEYLLLKNDTPFVYLVSFSRLFRSHKLICKAFWAFAQTKMRDFPTLLYSIRVAKNKKIYDIVKFLPFHIPDACKRYPFGRSLPA